MSVKRVDESGYSEKLPEDFEPYVKRWFNEKFDGLTAPQKHSFELIHENKNSLVSSPTGSGKTLSAFLSILNELFLKGDKGKLENKVYCLYVSPLRALGNDIQRNLKDPLDGIKEMAEEMNVDMPEVRSAVRTGDTPSQERQKMLKETPHILVTTPETLGIILNAPKFKEKLKEINYVIVDEIHSLCDNKRGAHLSLSLERLQEMCDHELTRIGLSATQAPIEEIARFLVGYENGNPRPCNIVQVSSSKDMDLKVLSPVDDLIHTSGEVVNDKMYDKIDTLVKNHVTTLIFTNTRSATERVVNNLKNKDPAFYEGDIGAHHSSMSRNKRLDVEESLKAGELSVVVTSTSLELGIDIGYIDLVLQLSSPKGVSRAIQRIGRSGHNVGDYAKGRVLVMERGDALECTEMMRCAKNGELDRVRIPENCLDVLSQHIVGMGCNRKWRVDRAYEIIRKSFNFRDLDREDYEKTLKYVAGEYASLEDQKVYGKIWIDTDEDGIRVFGRRGKMTRVIYMTNIGTIPDESAYRVHTRNGRFVGTLDEEFLDRLTKGDIFVHGGDTYEFRYTRGMKVYVDSRPERAPTVPSWFSEMLPLTYDLGRKIGKFDRKVLEKIKNDNDPSDWIKENYYLDENTVSSIVSYLEEQYHYVGGVPTDSHLLIEKNFENEKINLIFHTIFGREVNDALCRIFADIASEMLGSNVGIVVDDHGFVLICPRREISVNRLIERAIETDLREVLKSAVRKTELMKRRFRHVAARALMILRNYKGKKMSVGKQQMKSHFLLSACEDIDEEFPIVKETYREIIEDYMDIENASNIIEMLGKEEMSYEVVETDVPSPFAHNLVIQSRGDVLKLEDKKKRLQNLHEKVMEKVEGES
ncbi:MAG: ATP-dependent helicase [Candidatus Thermoplasmatota archaeon]|nr:ATP-dependent helicase [Candidatus Thermoplasmatota archaeon]MBS3789834.1 ATP-dependent helicase [Candidatus Thermoplasmatota archaeon]